jgi:acyl carrier protein
MNYKDSVLQGISKLIKKPIEEIRLDLELQADLQLDSLDIVELLMEIEESMAEDLDANTFENCKTVKDLIIILEGM